jgi:hypothetical protein
MKKTYKKYISEAVTTIKGIQPTGFKKYLRSENEIKQELKQHFNQSKITLDGIIKLFTQKYLKVDDNVVLNLNLNEIWKYREHDRHIFKPLKNNVLYNGINTKEYYDELKQDIKQNGIKEPIIFMMQKTSNDTFTVYVGEGNHRMSIAKELGIKTIPVRFV